MDLIIYLSNFIIPLVIFYIVGFGVLMKVNVYDSFVNGAKDGIRIVAELVPTLIGLMVGVGVLRNSGFLEFVAEGVGYLTQVINFPKELVPLAIVRLFSSSAATGLVLDIFKEYGTDTYIGMVASIMMGCTETVFYTMSVYFMTAGIRKTGWTLPGALIASVAGIAASVVIAGKI